MRRLTATLAFLVLIAPFISYAQAAATWIPVGSYLKPFSSTYGLLVPGLATSTTGCLSVNSIGWISANGSPCGSGLGSSGFSTTSTDYWKTQNNFFSTTSANYWSGFLNLGAATSSFSGAAPITVTKTASGIAIEFSGLTTSTQPLSSQVLVSDGRFSVFGVSTTTASCSGTASCPSFTILGSAPVTITGSGLAAYDPFSRLTTFATSTAATNTPIWTQGVFFSSSTKAASQFPYASTTAISATNAQITNLSNLTSNGFVKTQSGTGNLTIDTSTYLTSAVITGSCSGGMITCSGTNPLAIVSSAYPFTQNATSSRLYISGGLFASTTIQFGNTGLAQFFWDSAAGQLGIGTTSPRWPLTISTTSRPQIGITDGANTDGWAFRDAGNNFYLSTTSPTTFATSSQNSILTLLGGTGFSSGNMGLSSTTPWGRLSISNNFLANVPAFVVGSSSKAQFQITSGGQTAVCGSLLGAGGEYATSTTMVIDWQKTCPTITIWTSTSAMTITFINATNTSMYGSRKLIEILNPNGTAGALTWSNVSWGTTAPTQTTTANSGDTYSCYVGFATSSDMILSPVYKVRCGQSITGAN